MNAIKIENLTKYYGKSRGIDNVNLSVSEGEFFGFIGPNGAGKSTTIRLLLGLISPTSGSASVFNMDIKKDKQQILAETGYLSSEAMFYSGMKVKDILKLSADLRKKDCKANAEILCQRLQLDTAKKIEELSFGNRKKVGIVCALQHNPKLIILDEPTSGLDPLMQKEFYLILHELNKKGSTVFLSSHILPEIQHNCKKAAIIREGRIIACDSVDSLSNTNAKRISIQGEINISELSGVRDMQKDGENINFLYNGDIKNLLAVLSKGNIQNINISEPNLEEIFMHYYELEVTNHDDN